MEQGGGGRGGADEGAAEDDREEDCLTAGLFDASVEAYGAIILKLRSCFFSVFLSSAILRSTERDCCLCGLQWDEEEEEEEEEVEEEEEEEEWFSAGFSPLPLFACARAFLMGKENKKG